MSDRECEPNKKIKLSSIDFALRNNLSLDQFKDEIKVLIDTVSASNSMDYWFDFFRHEHDFSCIKFRTPAKDCNCGYVKFNIALQKYRQLSERK